MTYEVLSEEQVRFYREQGYLVVENRIPLSEIEALRAEIARLTEAARGMTRSDERLDLEDSHSPEAPRVRRIKLPHRQSPVFEGLMRSDWVLAPVRDLIGKDLRLHTSKLNMKSAGYGAAIEWHQDFAFYPHTNDDVLAVGVIIDDMAEENGPLMVFPQTHKGPIFDHHADGVFVGAMDLAASGFDMNDAVALSGPAGSISIHHGRIVHGSALNTSARDRRLLFYELLAADAFPLFGSMVECKTIEELNGRMVCGKTTVQPRLTDVPVRVPQPQPERNRSIYEVQSGLKARAFDVAR